MIIRLMVRRALSILSPVVRRSPLINDLKFRAVKHVC